MIRPRATAVVMCSVLGLSLAANVILLRARKLIETPGGRTGHIDRRPVSQNARTATRQASAMAEKQGFARLDPCSARLAELDERIRTREETFAANLPLL